jgi:hypothetical protein
MANYFSKFPKIYHSFDDYKTSEQVVNILSRFSLESSLKENTSIFYDYDIRDGDTPEIIASKMYDSAERHWIVLLFNDIIDPQYDWPLQYDVLTKYIDEKYLASANSNTSGDGITWSRGNIHSYYRVEKCTSPNRTITIKKYEVDANTYANTTISLNDSVVLPGNVTAVFDTTKETKTYYDYEMEENEKKRTIKLLKQEFVSPLELELENIT